MFVADMEHIDRRIPGERWPLIEYFPAECGQSIEEWLFETGICDFRFLPSTISTSW